MKIKCFTLMELALVFLLTSFCVSIAYTSLLTINKGFGKFRSRSQETWDATLFYTILYQDFFESEAVWRAPSGIICEQKDKIITYHFKPNGVLRENVNRTDTFIIETNNFDAKWEHHKLLVGNGLINSVSLNCKIGEKEHSFNLRKLYSTDVVLNAGN